ncbi:MAG: hypothetical protein HETSPECPRED_001067 [Heterodermia speciosa]|uniref:Dienelactone hydrolase domain-containing protein n=1 Tax=Heterodermia speciosa TaxID=116794 RepID=A0A8H3J0H6_9LECA|nr:MAG: hypothetical protein HETSPECPRED_001067 [Heterodermia speciosa]
MADDEVATKAPESDAAEQTTIPGDTPAQEGPTLGEHCVTDRPSPAGEPTGEISKIADIDVYITKPSDYPHLPSKLLLFLSSGSGIKSKNNQLQADKYAAEGFLVVMPDQFGGDPAPNSTSDPATDSGNAPSLLDKVKLGVAETAKSFMLDMWLARQTQEKVLPIIQKVIEGAKEEFADAVANGDGIYAVGYCFGGKYVLLLGAELPDTVAKGQALKDEEQGITKSGAQIRAGAVAHGTLITQEDIEKLKAPISLACTENDPLFPDEVRSSGEKFLVEQKINHEMRVYPGVPHGFAVVGEYEDAKIKEAQEAAFEQMIQWLKSH